MPDPTQDPTPHAEPGTAVNPQDPVHTTSPAATQYSSTVEPAPDHTAAKSAWVAYAEKIHGAGAAKNMTKKQIIENFDTR